MRISFLWTIVIALAGIFIFDKEQQTKQFLLEEGQRVINHLSVEEVEKAKEENLEIQAEAVQEVTETKQETVLVKNTPVRAGLDEKLDYSAPSVADVVFEPEAELAGQVDSAPLLWSAQATTTVHHKQEVTYAEILSKSRETARTLDRVEELFNQ